MSRWWVASTWRSKPSMWRSGEVPGYWVVARHNRWQVRTIGLIKASRVSVLRGPKGNRRLFHTAKAAQLAAEKHYQQRRLGNDNA